MTNACIPRSRADLLSDVTTVDPEHNSALQPRDITGDGIKETFCNVFVRTVLALGGIDIPAMLANKLFEWFPGPEATALGWRKVTPAEAIARAELGFRTVGVWRNPRGHGHIVLVVPAIDSTTGFPAKGMHSAQAGSRNWNNEPIERAGLLSAAYSFFTYD